MKKVIYSFVLIFMCLFFVNNKVDAIDVSNNSYSLYGNTYSLDNQYYNSLKEEVEKNCSSCKNHSVKELCVYLDSKSDISGEQRDDVSFDDKYKILFIFDNNSAGIGWYASASWKYTGYLLNWKENNDSNWNKINLDNDDDASAAYKSSGDCPTYLAHSKNYGDNYFLLSTSGNYSNLTHINQLIKKAPGNDIHTYYSMYDQQSTSGEKFTCDYGPLKVEVGVDGSVSNYELPYGSKINNNGQADNSGNLTVALTYLNSKFRSSKFKSYFKNKQCPKVAYACAVRHLGYFWSDTDLAGNINFRDIVIYGAEDFITNDKCPTEDIIQFQCNGENCSDEDICVGYDDLKLKLDQVMDSYKSCSDKKCKSSALSEYNKQKDILNSFCTSVMKNNNYSEGGCISKCLTIHTDFANYEKEMGLRTDYDDKAKCGIGTSIVNMVYNVLKWAKYIAPALVIILTMLDFIKAIAAQNDDDMKKAQGKFVKRLIVAALLFLLPLIINFILQTFGLYDSSCDITDLF